MTRARLSTSAVVVIIIAGCLISALTNGPRSVLGLFLVPMTDANGWGREVFSLAIAIQGLAWGMAQPAAGLLADKFGTVRVLIGGALIYVAGLIMMAYTSDPVMLQLTAGVVLGLGISGSAFILVLAAFARRVPEHLRTLAFGLGTAAGSAGQLICAPLGRAFIDAYGFQVALLLFAALVAVVPFLAMVLDGRPQVETKGSGPAVQSARAAIAEAFGHRSYVLLVLGFFVCGYHVSFIAVHYPPYLSDSGLDPAWGGNALALIGLFNIFGAIGVGYLGTYFYRPRLLSSIYFFRAIVFAGVLILPVTPVTTAVFSAAIGLLWLSTVPLTQALVGSMFGPRYVATLFGFVFLSHQVGGFLGVWLGGSVYDRTGSYDIVWWTSIILALAAAVIHLPIRDQMVERPASA